MMRFFTIGCLFFLLMQRAAAQTQLQWKSLPSLPDNEGFAGMFAGVSGGALFCMGGANFPGKKPWEGGAKKWYSGIYMLQEGKQWVQLPDTLPLPLAYGVTVSHNNKIYLIGGSNSTAHSDRVVSLTWNDNRLLQEELPSLPRPLANMAGALVNDLIIIAGGAATPGGDALKTCFALDLTSPDKGWFALPSWPGPERTLPVCAVHQGTFYLFSGETVGTTPAGDKYRYILQDAYSFSPVKKGGRWTGTWKTLAPLPKGASAAGSPLPVLPNGTIVISGGVDALTALHTNPTDHPGINRDIQLYYTGENCWQLLRPTDNLPARVTLPTVYWNDQWVFISGEIKPGIRTPTIRAIKN